MFWGASIVTLLYSRVQPIRDFCPEDGASETSGEGRAGAHVRLEEALPDRVHAVDIAALLTRETNRGRFDPLDSETLLLVYLPAGVTLIDAFVPRYCAGGSRAFHRALRLGKTTIPYRSAAPAEGEAEVMVPETRTENRG